MKIVEHKVKTVNVSSLKPGTVFRFQDSERVFMRGFRTEQVINLSTGAVSSLKDYTETKVIPYENAVLCLNNEV